MKSANNSHQGKILCRKNGFKIINCEKCQFIHISPLPKAENIQKIYPKKYYEEESPYWIKKTLAEKDYWLLTYSEKFEYLETIITQKRKKILDIGSFIGLFLQVGKKRGWEVLGIEPSQKASRIAQKNGIPTRIDFFENVTFQAQEKFDVINSELTFEHILNPVEVMTKAHSLLNNGGILVVQVPNDFSLIQAYLHKDFKKPFYWVSPPHHINYFTPDSMSKLLERCGFQVIQHTSTFPMEFFILMGDDYIGNDLIGRRCHNKRMNLETHLSRLNIPGFKKNLYELFAKYNLGRELVIYAQKTKKK
ncbi:class I SAM-dependent methyltransferase [Candidatus Microgenomates bacterium]|nr:MAG: class I SAM-dependent methyltransferase [Candidatus Microgenomates bacterium]